MCGIVAYYGGAGNNLTRVLTGMSAIIYRAPDSTGIGFFGDDREPVRARKTLGSVSNLTKALRKHPAYPNHDAALLSLLTADTEKLSIREFQRRLLKLEGFSLDTYDKLISLRQSYPTFDDLVVLEGVPAFRMEPGFPGNPDTFPAFSINSLKELTKTIHFLIETYDLSTVLIQSLIRDALAETIDRVGVENAGIGPGEILDAFDVTFEKAALGGRLLSPSRMGEKPFPQNPNVQKTLWRLLRQTPIKVPSDFDRDGVRCLFRLLDAALMCCLPHNPELAAEIEKMMVRRWLEKDGLGAVDWETLYHAEKGANVYGRAAAAGLEYLQKQDPLSRLGDTHSKKSTASKQDGLQPGRTDPCSLRFITAPVISHGRWAIQSPVTLTNAHPFFDAEHKRLIVLNGQFEGNVETQIQDFLKKVGKLSFRSKNSTEYLPLLWGYYFQRLKEDQQRAGAIQSQVELGLESYSIGSQALDYQMHHHVKDKSLIDLDEMAFREAVRQLTREGGQIAAVGISLESPRRLYVASHNRPVFVVRRLENDDFMVVSDLNAAMGLFPQSVIHQKSIDLLRVEKQKQEALSRLKHAGADKNTLRSAEKKFRNREARILEAFLVEVYPLDGENIFSRIETYLDHGAVCRSVLTTDLDGNPLPDIEPFQTTLRPPSLRNDLYSSYYETHLHEIPECMSQILNTYVTEDGGLPDFQLQKGLLRRRFGRDFGTLKRIVLVGMGSSYNMALIGRNVFHALIPTLDVMVLRPPDVDDIYTTIEPDTDLVVLLSWSATTADMVAFAKTLAVTKVAMIAVTGKVFGDMALVAQKSGGIIPVLSGEEVTVSGIKSTLSTLLCLELFAAWLASRMKEKEAARTFMSTLQKIPDAVHDLLSNENCARFCKKLASDSRGSYAVLILDTLEMIGRAREVALKLEETSWTAVGKPQDFNHALLSGLKKDMNKNLVLVNATGRAQFPGALKVMAALREADIPFGAVCIKTREQNLIDEYAEGRCVRLPDVLGIHQAYVDLVFYYIFAHHYGMAHGRHAADFPRNRTKSVTAGRSFSPRRQSPSRELMLMEQYNHRVPAISSEYETLSKQSIWETMAGNKWESSYYGHMRRLADILQNGQPRGKLFRVSADDRKQFSRRAYDLVSKKGEILFIPLDREAETAVYNAAPNWQRLLGCAVRVQSPICPFKAFTGDKLLIFAKTTKPDEAMLSEVFRKTSCPVCWVGPKLKEETGRLFSQSAGKYTLLNQKGLTSGDFLYASLCHLLVHLWKDTHPARAATVKNHLKIAGRVILSILNSKALKSPIQEVMLVNKAYQTAYLVGPPTGLGRFWLDRFALKNGVALACHHFGESAHGPIVTVDPRVNQKFVRLESRKDMVHQYGRKQISQWEKEYLGGKNIDHFLHAPPKESPVKIEAPFFAEGAWYFPELQIGYDTAQDNLIILDATSEHYFAQALDELATYGCRYARMVVLSQEAFAHAPDKRALYRHPISDLIQVPAIWDNNSESIPVSDLLLPFSMNLIGTAFAAAAGKMGPRPK